MFISVIFVPVCLLIVNHYVTHLRGDNLVKDVITIVITRFPSALIGFVFTEYKLFDKIESGNFKIIRSKTANVVIQVICALCITMGRWIIRADLLNFGVLPMDQKYASIDVSREVVYAPLFINAL